jgi:phosphatidylserine decarboxylase
MIARGGYNWILGTLLISAVSLLYYLSVNIAIFLGLAIVLLVFVLFLFIFFRDPERYPRPGPGIVAPADGKVIMVSKTSHQNRKFGGKKSEHQGTTRIAIFMNVTNVHVNRSPVSGRVLSTEHYPGGYAPAYLSEARQNERLITKMKTAIGNIEIIQIAGLIAQRIVPYIEPGQYLKKGERIGIIQFGSRVDLIIPTEKITVKINVGARVSAGTTEIAEISSRYYSPGALK